VAELLLEKKIPAVVDCGTTPENHIAALRSQPPLVLLIVDAADMGITPGELRRLSIEELDSATAVSHNIPMSLLLSPFTDAFEIAVLGIQPETTRMGEPLSGTAEKAAHRVAYLIERGEWETIQRL